MISYRDYFNVQYGIHTILSGQPLILADAKIEKQVKKGKKMTEKVKQTYLIPELLCLVGLSPQHRQNEALMKNVAEFSRMDPPKRLQEAKELIKVVNQKAKIIQVSNEPVQVPGFILKKPIFRVRN